MKSEDLYFQVKNLIKELSFTFQSFSLYEERHPKVKKAIEELFHKFEEIFKAREEISFGIVGEELFSGKEIFFDLTLQVKDFIKVLKERKIDYVRFKKGLAQDELKTFLRLLKEKEREVSADNNLAHIRVGRFGEEKEILEKEAVSFEEKIASLNFLYESILRNITTTLTQSLRRVDIDTSLLGGAANKLFTLLVHHKYLLFTLLSLKRRQDYTFIHSLNVATLSMFQARILGLSQDKVVKIGVAGLLHDIGKIAIRKKLIEKSEEISMEEFEKIKSHTILGSKIILSSPHFDELSFIVSFQHHLRFDLKGYPKVRFLKKQNLASKIVCISDVYDALRSRRAYREPMPLERVYEIMQKEKARLFDPYLLELFYKNLGVWPVGTLVRLDTQEVGLVRESNPQDIFRPKVEIFYSPEGEKLKESIIVDLLQRDGEGNFKRRILRELNPLGEGQRFISELFGKAVLG